MWWIFRYPLTTIDAIPVNFHLKRSIVAEHFVHEKRAVLSEKRKYDADSDAGW